MSNIRLTATLSGTNESQLRNDGNDDGGGNDDSEQLFINNQPPPHIDDLFPDVSKRDAPEWLIDDDLTKYGNFDENAVFSWGEQEPLLADLDAAPPPQHVAGNKMTKNAKSLTIDDLLGEDLFTRAVGGEIVDLIQFEYNKTTSSGASCLIGNVDPAISEADAIIQRIRDGSLTLEHNQKLPIFKFKDEILNKLKASSIIFLHGDTGCGKSMQILVYILEQYLLAKHPCNIIVTQPRRLAASSVAAFAASSHGWRLGSVVGYHVIIDRKTTTTTPAARNDGTPADFCSGTRITYCTTGILLQKLIYRPDILSQYTHIIFDEVQERSADLDLAMMLTRQLVQPPNPETKIVVMSATFEANKYWRDLCNNELPAAVNAGKEEESIPDNICVTIHLSQFRVDNAYLDEMMQLHAQQALLQRQEDDEMHKKETSSHVQLFDDNNDDDDSRRVDDSHRRRSSIEALPIINRFGDIAKLNLALAAFKSEEILEEPKVLLPIMQFAASIVVELEITERRRMVAERKLGIRARDRSSFDGQKGNVEYGKGVLIFLPGIEDILTMKSLLNQHRMRIRRACGAGSSLNIVTLHSSAVSLAEQLRQLEQAPSQQRRVVLSTNVGESSITLPDIGYVIDLCLTKQMFWSPDSAWTSLDVVWASKCSAEQRAGRCGRTCNGFVYRMVPKIIYDGPTIPDVDVPEVQRTPIHATILRVRAFADAVYNNDDENYDDDGQFIPNHQQTASPVDLLNMLLEPPSMDIVEKSTMHLKNIGALTVLAPSADDGGVGMPSHVNGILTALGDACIKMPCDVFITRFLMLAFACNLLQEAVEIGAVLSLRDTIFMVSRFSGASGNDDDFAEEEEACEAFAAVRTGVLVDLVTSNEANSVHADEGFNDEQNKNDSSDTDDYQDSNGKTSSTLSDMYSHYQHLLKWDNAGQSDTFAFVAAYRYWKREIRSLAAHSGRARCERLCKRVALCQERLEQVYAIERELTKRLCAMRLLQRDNNNDGDNGFANKCWNREPNEQAKLLVLKMLLAAACSPHFFQVVSPEHKIPARSYRDYLYSTRTEMLSYASNELSNCSLSSSVLVSLKRHVVNLEQQQQQPKKGGIVMTSDRPAEPITIFDQQYIRDVFADLCCHLPVHTRIHFLTPSNLTTLSAPLRVMQFIVAVCRMAHESSTATGRNNVCAADVDGEASLAVQLLLHKLRLPMLEAGNVKRSSGALYQSVHGGDENCGLSVLAVTDVRKLQIEVPKTGGNSSKQRKLQTLDAVMYDDRKPILSEIHANLMQSATPRAAAKGFMLEVDYENGDDKASAGGGGEAAAKADPAAAAVLPPDSLRAQRQSLPHDNIAEALYSHDEAMQHLAGKKVLICGLGGLGVEIAKNIILSGVRYVMLHDTLQTTQYDLGMQFCLTERDLHKNRAECSVASLKMNADVTVKSSSMPELTLEFVREHHVVVLVQLSLDQQLLITGFAQIAGARVIVANVFGLCAQVFCDFGEQFYAFDLNDEQPWSATVVDISRGRPGVVTCKYPHGFQNGDRVRFNGVLGMVEVNEGSTVAGSADANDAFDIRYLNPYSFSICDTSRFSPYKYEDGEGGEAAKLWENLSFKPFDKAWHEPVFLDMDSAKFARSQQMHLAFQVMYKYIEIHSGDASSHHALHPGSSARSDSPHDVISMMLNALPRSWNADDAQTFLDLASKYNREVAADGVEVDAIDEELMRMLAFTARGQVAPIMSTVGGVVALEVMKACSGKFSPISQWMYFDALECLPLQLEDWPREADCVARQSRYDGQIALFGAPFQDKLSALKVFVVGAGAIGCEVLKNLAMMGVACRDDGMIYVVDRSTIDNNNLNRQFLFRPSDVGKLKSQVAAEAVKKMNGQTHITAHQNEDGPGTENIYNDDFFKERCCVVNALDNVEARMYIDRRCALYKKSLGMLGAQANVQVVMPHKTESYKYSSSQDPPEKTIPMCTLHNFPNAIEHTLQWARDLFEGLFKRPAQIVDKYLQDEQFCERVVKLPGVQPMEVMDTLKKAMVDNHPHNAYENCIVRARRLFQVLFHNNIRQLLYDFPPEHITSRGARFWSGSKRCPHTLVFDSNNNVHVDFIISAANLMAFNYGLPQSHDREWVRNYVSRVAVPEFKPKSGVKIAVTDAEVQQQQQQQQQGSDNGNGEAGPPRVQDIIAELSVKPKQSKQQHASSGSSAADSSSSSTATASSAADADVLQQYLMHVIEFEKYDDSNFHLDFIVATSNLRAENYDIQRADRRKSKLVDGKIIPAIATTTSLVVGLSNSEYCEIRIGKHQALERCREAYFNLALPSVHLSLKLFLEFTRREGTETADSKFLNMVDGEVESGFLVRPVPAYYLNIRDQAVAPFAAHAEVLRVVGGPEAAVFFNEEDENNVG